MLGLGLSTSALAIRPRGGGVVPPQPPNPLAYTMLQDFEAVAGTPSSAVVTSQDTSARKARGAAGMNIVGNSTNLSQSVSNILTTTRDFANDDVIVLAVDCGDRIEGAQISTIRPTFTIGGSSYALRVDTANGGSYNSPFTSNSRGKRWLAWQADRFRVTDFNGASIRTTGTASKQINLGTMNGVSPGTANTDVTVDAFCLPASHKPALLLTFDDCNVSQYNLIYPRMKARGLVGSLYICEDVVDASAKLTTAMIREMVANGWGACVDSDAADRPLTAYATINDMLSGLNGNRDRIRNKYGDTEGAKHLCYSYGVVGYPDAPYTTTLTCNGTTSASTPAGGTAAYTFLAPGMRIVGANVPANTYVTLITGQNTFTANNALPATVGSVTFLARTPGITTTCNGTMAVTVSATANLFVGQHMIGYQVPADTRITGIISGTAITVSNAVPAACTRANFSYYDGEFHHTKVQDALIANGYRSGRRVNSQVMGLYTGYGVDPKAALDWPGVSLDTPASLNTNLLNIRQMTAERQDAIAYMHNPSDTAYLDSLFDAIASDVQAGRYEVLSVPAWWTKASARLTIN